MRKKQIKHFVPGKDSIGCGTPACNCFQEPDFPNLPALRAEVAKTRKDTNCKNCRRTRVFRKLK